MHVRVAALALLIGCELPSGTPDPGNPPQRTITTPPATSSGLSDVIAAVLVDEPLTDSCSDLTVYVHEETDSNVLVVSVTAGLAEEARVSEDDVTETFDLPHPDVVVRAIWGSNVGEWHSCDDVAEVDPVIAGELDALSGSVTVTVHSHPDATEFQPYAFATVELQDITFTPDPEDDETIDDVELADLFVGWLPG